uniref:Uncharacterized protein n=1 Tax=Romanomermis culicivorax TaxID=13658 RepID=A0A915IMD8_ROMCU
MSKNEIRSLDEMKEISNASKTKVQETRWSKYEENLFGLAITVIIKHLSPVFVFQSGNTEPGTTKPGHGLSGRAR